MQDSDPSAETSRRADAPSASSSLAASSAAVPDTSTAAAAAQETAASSAALPASRAAWPDYRAVWRWHFYASLFCMPFVVVLSITGAIYLFKPQVEAWVDRPYDNLSIDGPRATVADQVKAALAAVPDSLPSGYEIPPTERSAARVVVRKGGDSIRVYVHPRTLAVLHQVREDERLMRWMFKLHGELLLGDRGSNLVELASSWTIIMLATGLYLWWPRGLTRWAGVVYPRLRHGSRILWRDLHSVVGIWISAFALFLLLTGLPWAKFWGNYFKAARRWTGTAVAQQDWTTGSERGEGTGGASKSGSSKNGASGRSTGGKSTSSEQTGQSGRGEHSGHGEHGGASGGGRRRGGGSMPKDMTAFDRVYATVAPLGLADPVVIAPPSRGSDDWTAKSMAQNRPLRVNLVVNGATGAIVSREDFRDRHWVDRVVGVGIAAHEGQLFGLPNQLLGLATALGLITLSVSGVVLWWRRRDKGTLGAPKPLAPSRWSWGLVAIIVALGLYLPLFGASLIGMLLIEQLVLKRIPRVRDWLGLQPTRRPSDSV